MKRAPILPLSLLLVLAGCAAPGTPGLTIKPIAKDAAGQTAQSQGNGSTAQANPTGDNGQATATVNHSGGTSVNTSVDITAPGSNAPNGAAGTGVVVGTPLAMTALAGGRYVSADGLLSADIPPGALTQDAVVHISRIDTSSDKVTIGFVPGVRFAVDLGGARLAADKSIVVSTKVDSRFVKEMQSRDAAFTPDKYNLKQDASGNWLMQMAVKGPTTQPVVRPAFANVSLHLIENGVLPLPNLVQAAASRTLMGISSAADCKTWSDTTQVAVPTDRANWYANESAGKYSCGAFDGQGWYMNIYHDVMSSQATCGASGTPDPQASIAPLATADIPTHTTWDSDDPALKGKDAVGANVRFDLAWSPQNGPSDVVADAAGLAKSYTLAGLPVGLTANTAVGPAKGATTQVTASAAMPVVELTCPKFSPHISFHVESASPLPAKLTVKFTLDGVAQTQALTPVAGSKTVNLQVYLIVPDDKDHEIKVTGVDAGGDFGLTPPGPDTQQVHRNGTYTLNMRLQNIIAH
jgi:hypothetical protein